LSEANGIDMSGPVRLAEVDERMIRALMLKDHFRYLVLTVTGKGVGDRVWPTSAAVSARPFSPVSGR